MFGKRFRTKAALGGAGLWLAIVPVSARATPVESPERWVRYDDSQGLFSIRFPAEWKRKPVFGSVSSVWFAGEGGGCHVLLGEYPESAALTSEEALLYFSQLSVAEQLHAGYEDVKLLSSRRGRLAGLPAQIQEFQYSTSPPGRAVPVRQLSAWAFRSGISYEAICTSPADGFVKIEAAFRAVLDSFTLPPLTLPENLRVAPRIVRDKPSSSPPLPPPSSVSPANAAYLLFVYPLLALFYAWLARRRQRNPLPWAILGPLFFPIALILLARKPLPCPLCGFERRKDCAFCSPKPEAPAEEPALAPVAPWKGIVSLLKPIALAKGEFAAYLSIHQPFWKRGPVRTRRMLPVTGVDFSRDTWELRIQVGGLLRGSAIPLTGLTIGDLVRRLEDHLETAAHCRLVLSGTFDLSRDQLRRKVIGRSGEWSGPPMEELPEKLTTVVDLPFRGLTVRADDKRRRLLLTARP